MQPNDNSPSTKDLLYVSLGREPLYREKLLSRCSMGGVLPSSKEPNPDSFNRRYAPTTLLRCHRRDGHTGEHRAWRKDIIGAERLVTWKTEG